MRLRSALVAAALFAASESQASALALRLQIGYPLYFVDIDVDRREQLKAQYAISLEVSKFFNTLPLALGVSYEGVIKGKYGTLPINHTGIAAYYYPFGIPHGSENIDGNVAVRISRPAAFVRMAAGLTFINFRDGNEVATFGASAINYQVGGGFDYPIGDDFMVGAIVNYLTTFGGTRPETGTDTVAVNMTGFTFGLRLTYFWP